MSIIGKGIGAVVLAIAGSTLAVDPTGAAVGISAHALTIAAGLAGGIAGNEAHAAYAAFGDHCAAALFRRHPQIDRNHHIMIALRLSHLDAMDAIFSAFNTARDGDFDRDRRAAAERVSALLRTYLKEARQFASGGDASKEEKRVLGALPTAYETALAARSVAIPDAKVVRKELEDSVLAELSVEIGGPLPALLITVFHGSDDGHDGWHDLFVRSASARLKTNKAFKSIWNAEQLARIGATLSLVDMKVDRVLEGQAAATQTAERNQRELIEIQQRILEQVSREKGVPTEELMPVLTRLIGHADVPQDKFARVFGEAVDDLLVRSQMLSIVHNDYPEIDRAINAARKKLENLDIEGALATVRKAQGKQRLQRHDQDKADARLFFEEADILLPLYDHDGVTTALEKALELDPDPLWRWDQLGRELRKIGRPASAIVAFEAALNAALKNGDRNTICVFYERIGDIRRAEGDAKGAMNAYIDSFDIVRALAEHDPSDAELQRNLSISYGRIASMRQSEGNAKEAMQAHKKSFKIAKALVERDEDNAQWQRDLSISYDHIGDLHRAACNSKDALEAYTESFNISKSLSERDPNNAEWQRDLSVSYRNIAKMRHVEGDALGARMAYKQSFDIAKALTGRDPGNVEWQRDLSVSYGNIGDMYRVDGESKSALQAYRDGLAIIRTLAERDSNNAVFQRDLAISYDRIGKILLLVGDTKSALLAYEDNLRITKMLTARDPANTQWQRDLMLSYYSLAKCEPRSASHHYGMALKIAVVLRNGGKLAQADAWIPDELAARIEAIRPGD